MWSFGRKSDSRKHIHDQVDPKKLNDGEWAVSKEGAGKDYNEEAGDVASKLELDEFSAIIDDIAAPSDSGHNGGEVIVEDDNIGMILGD